MAQGRRAAVAQGRAAVPQCRREALKQGSRQAEQGSSMAYRRRWRRSRREARAGCPPREWRRRCRRGGGGCLGGRRTGRLGKKKHTTTTPQGLGGWIGAIRRRDEGRAPHAQHGRAWSRPHLAVRWPRGWRRARARAGSWRRRRARLAPPSSRGRGHPRRQWRPGAARPPRYRAPSWRELGWREAAARGRPRSARARGRGGPAIQTRAQLPQSRGGLT